MLYLFQISDKLEKMASTSVEPAVLPSGSQATILKKRSSTPVVARKSTVSITPSEVSVESYMESLSQEVSPTIIMLTTNAINYFSISQSTKVKVTSTTNSPSGSRKSLSSLKSSLKSLLLPTQMVSIICTIILLL